jgi:polysaccharide pyruvyl transferase WcaK-like protein
LLGLVINKPTVIYAQSIGPFNNFIIRNLARFILRRVDLVTVREKITLEYLNNIGIHGHHIHLTSDSAFLLEPAPRGTIRKILEEEGITVGKKPLIGISPSQAIHRWAVKDSANLDERYVRYVNFMANIADYLIEKLDATVLLIPHVMTSNGDGVVSRKILHAIKNKGGVRIIKHEYDAEEMKGIIGACDMMIGCRTHSTIASTSMYVPTISIAYSHKTQGIIGEMLGQKDFIVDIRKKNFDDALLETISKIDSMWANRGRIRRELKEKMIKVRKSAELNAKLVKSILT